MRIRHRVALEVEVDDDPGQPEPEDWDVAHLTLALRSGQARAVRTIQGLVVDPERDRLSSTLAAVAEGLEEAAQLHWLATARPWPDIAPRLRSARPSLELLVELDQLAAVTRRVARHLQQERL